MKTNTNTGLVTKNWTKVLDAAASLFEASDAKSKMDGKAPNRANLSIAERLFNSKSTFLSAHSGADKLTSEQRDAAEAAYSLYRADFRKERGLSANFDGFVSRRLTGKNVDGTPSHVVETLRQRREFSVDERIEWCRTENKVISAALAALLKSKRQSEKPAAKPVETKPVTETQAAA